MYSRHSATASDMPLLEQSRTSTHSDNSDSKENPDIDTKASGDCIAINQRSGLKIHSNMNGVISDPELDSQQVNGKGHIENGDIHLSPVEPFLLNET